MILILCLATFRARADDLCVPQGLDTARTGFGNCTLPGVSPTVRPATSRVSMHVGATAHAGSDFPLLPRAVGSFDIHSSKLRGERFQLR
jgi:hypothetical protein